MRSPGHLLTLMLGSSVALTPFRCNNEGPPPAAPKTPATVIFDGGLEGGPAFIPLDSGAMTDSGAAADAGPDFYACSADSDCVAVPKVGCCNNGHKEAVNKQSVEAYRASFVCRDKHHMCPQYMIVDSRQALCDASSRKCQMVAPPK